MGSWACLRCRRDAVVIFRPEPSNSGPPIGVMLIVSSSAPPACWIEPVCIFLDARAILAEHVIPRTALFQRAYATHKMVRHFHLILPYCKISCMPAYRTAYRTKISSKGQVVIPAELREQFGLEKGTPATWIEDQGTLLLQPITERTLDDFMAFLKTPRGKTSMFEYSFEERHRERARANENK